MITNLDRQCEGRISDLESALKDLESALKDSRRADFRNRIAYFAIGCVVGRWLVYIVGVFSK